MQLAGWRSHLHLVNWSVWCKYGISALMTCLGMFYSRFRWRQYDSNAVEKRKTVISALKPYLHQRLQLCSNSTEAVVSDTKYKTVHVTGHLAHPGGASNLDWLSFVRRLDVVLWRSCFSGADVWSPRFDIATVQLVVAILVVVSSWKLTAARSTSAVQSSCWRHYDTLSTALNLISAGQHDDRCAHMRTIKPHGIIRHCHSCICTKIIAELQMHYTNTLTHSLYYTLKWFRKKTPWLLNKVG